MSKSQLRLLVKGLIAEATALDKSLYGSLEKAIANSNFWIEGNTEDDGDYEEIPGLDLIHQTSAAQRLQDDLQAVIDSSGEDIIIAVQSPELDANPSFLLTPDKPQYPDSVISGGYATITPGGKQAVVLNMSLFDDAFNDDDVNAQRIARKGAAILRHEMVHLQQVAARAESEGISLLDAFENFKKEPKSIPPSGAGRQQYIKSHIEVDAHAHQAADELLSLYGKEEALRLISKTVDFEDLGVDLPHAIEDYLVDNPSGKTARQFRKKAYEYINAISQGSDEKLNEVGPGVGMDPTAATMPKGMKRSDYKQLEAANPEAFRIVMSILDPTGLLSIPDVPPAVEAFEKNKTLTNALFLVLAVTAVVPVIGMAPELAQRVVTAVKGAKKVINASPAMKASASKDFYRKLDAASDKAAEIQRKAEAPKPRSPEQIEKQINLDRNKPKQKRIDPDADPTTYYRKRKIGQELGLTDMEFAGRGVDAATYIAKLDVPIGRHKEVAVKILQGTAYEAENLKNAKWVLDNRASLPPDVRKYLPQVLDIGKTAKGQNYTVVEKLDPLPAEIRSLFRVRPQQQIAKILKDPDRFSIYVDDFVDEGFRFLSKGVTTKKGTQPMIGPSAKKGIKASIMKIYNNPESISSDAKAIVSNLNFDKIGISPAQREGLKNTIPGYINYIVGLRKAVESRVIGLEKAVLNPGLRASAPENMVRLGDSLDHAEAQLKVLDDYIKSMSSDDFWNVIPDNLDGAEFLKAAKSGKYQAGGWLPAMDTITDEIPMALAVRRSGEAVHPDAARKALKVDPLVKKVTDAMKEIRKAGFEPFDLHADNWMIRPGTGDIVMSDFGRFNRISLNESNNVVLRNVIRRLIKEKKTKKKPASIIKDLHLDKEVKALPSTHTRVKGKDVPVNKQIVNYLKKMRMVSK